jgi:hypothetical protein
MFTLNRIQQHGENKKIKNKVILEKHAEQASHLVRAPTAPMEDVSSNPLRGHEFGSLKTYVEDLWGPVFYIGDGYSLACHRHTQLPEGRKYFSIPKAEVLKRYWRELSREASRGSD